MEIKKILVATDFTEVADVALKHAAKLASVSNGDIYVLHVVKEDDTKLVKEAKEKINAQAAKVGAQNVKRLVRIGNFINEIGDAAAEVQAQFIVMGTHGPRGFKQTVTGSDAMKVVTHSTKPFIVTQQREIGADGYKSVVVPLDMSDDSKQKLDEVADIARYFKSKIHIFARKEKDSSLAVKLRSNIIFAKKYYAGKGIELDVKVSENKKAFDEEMLDYAVEVEADLIAIVNTLKWNMFGGLFSRREEHIITNEHKIPVLCVNPIDVKGGGYSM